MRIEGVVGVRSILGVWSSSRAWPGTGPDPRRSRSSAGPGPQPVPVLSRSRSSAGPGPQPVPVLSRSRSSAGPGPPVRVRPRPSSSGPAPPSPARPSLIPAFRVFNATAWRRGRNDGPRLLFAAARQRQRWDIDAISTASMGHRCCSPSSGKRQRWDIDAAAAVRPPEIQVRGHAFPVGGQFGSGSGGRLVAECDRSSVLRRYAAAPLPVLGPGGPALRVGLPSDDLGGSEDASWDCRLGRSRGLRSRAVPFVTAGDHGFVSAYLEFPG